MFTPAGVQSRRQRTTRARPRTTTADPPTTPLSGPRSHLSSASDTVQEQSTSTVRTAIEGLPTAPGSASRGRYDTASEDETYDTFNTTPSVNDRMSIVTTKRLRLSSQDIESSLNRRRSLRSASRSLDPSASPGSSRRASLAEYSNEDLSIEYDVTQSSLDQSDGTLHTSYTVDKETQFHETGQQVKPHQDRKISTALESTQFDQTQYKTKRISSSLQRALCHFKQACKSNRRRALIRACTIRATTRQLILAPLLLASLLGAMGYLYHHASRMPLSRGRPLYNPPDTIPKDSVELLSRMMKLEKCVGEVSRQVQWLQEGVENMQQKSSDNALRLVGQDSRLDSLGGRLTNIQDQIPLIEGRLDDFSARHIEITSDIALSQASIDSMGQTINLEIQEWQAAAVTIEERIANLELAEKGDTIPDRNEFMASIYDEMSTSISYDVLEKINPLLYGAPHTHAQNNSDIIMPNSETWLHFLHHNKHELKQFIDGQYNEIMDEAETQGRFISRPEVLSILKSEFKALMNRSATYLVDGVAVKYHSAENGSRLSAADSLLEHIVTKGMHSDSLDVLAQPDYAAYTSGARINPFLTSSTYLHRPTQIIPRILSRMLFSIGSIWSHAPAVAITSNNAIGMCWAFPGTKGQLSIKLSRPIRLRSIIVEHLHTAVAHDTSSAPRDIEIWAHLDPETRVAYESDMEHSTEHEVFRSPPSDGYIHIMDITYQLDNNRDPIQIFYLPLALKSLNILADEVLLRVNSNWGHKEFTCLYRVRVGGAPAEPITDHDSISLDHDEEI